MRIARKTKRSMTEKPIDPIAPIEPMVPADPEEVIDPANEQMLLSKPEAFISLHNDQLTTTSLKIAEVFGKRHADVIRDIESLQVPDTWYKRNFALIQNTVDLGLGRIRHDKSYTITRDGFTILVMGFTGAKAMQFKIAYIEAFNTIERALHARHVAAAKRYALQVAPLSWEVKGGKLFMNKSLVVPQMLVRVFAGLTDGLSNHYFSCCKSKYEWGVDYFKVVDTETLFEIHHATADDPFLSQKFSQNSIYWTYCGLRKLAKVLEHDGVKHNLGLLFVGYFKWNPSYVEKMTRRYLEDKPFKSL